MFNKKTKKMNIEKLINVNETDDKYILDDENAIIVVRNPNSDNKKDRYIMIHQRLVDGKLTEVNKWYIDLYYFGSIHYRTIMKDLNLFKVQNGCGRFNALYDYKNDKFVVPIGDWNELESGHNDNILEEYNGFLASFDISSDYDEDDVYSYINPITQEKIVESFFVNEPWHYYAIVNLDGTIRGNKLFKGFSFSKIFEIIDLDKYESLDAFKKEKIEICNAQKQKAKQEYMKKLESRNDGSISPYLDSEVAKVLNLKK